MKNPFEKEEKGMGAAITCLVCDDFKWEQAKTCGLDRGKGKGGASLANYPTGLGPIAR